jgi:hypothetical protein
LRGFCKGWALSPIAFIGHASRSCPALALLRSPSNKILCFVASVRALFVRQLYRAERIFPAIENRGGVCEEEASKEDRHKKR